MTAQASSQRTPSMDATQHEVLADVRNHIGHLTLNRPAGLNAITLDMVRLLQQQLDAWASDAEVHAVRVQRPEVVAGGERVLRFHPR